MIPGVEGSSLRMVLCFISLDYHFFPLSFFFIASSFFYFPRFFYYFLPDFFASFLLLSFLLSFKQSSKYSDIHYQLRP